MSRIACAGAVPVTPPSEHATRVVASPASSATGGTCGRFLAFFAGRDAAKSMASSCFLAAGDSLSRTSANRRLDIDAFWTTQAGAKRGHAWFRTLLARVAQQMAGVAD